MSLASDIIRNMAIILKQTDNRSKYQEKLAKELQEKAKNKALESELPDGVKDSAYIKGTQKTDVSSVKNILAGILAAVIVAALIWFVSK